MKKLIVGLTLTAAFAANAQTTTATLPASSSATQAPAATAAPATQTLTTEAEAAASNKFGALFYVENSMLIKDQNELNEKAGFDSIWYMGLKYKPTKKVGFELWQMAQSRSNFEGTYDKDVTYNQGKSQVMLDAVVKANYASDLRLPGSEAIAFSTRYYLPTSQVTREILHRNGQLRFDINPSWILSPSWTFDMINSPRLIFMDQASSDGAETVYRYVGGPAITYNFNDAFNAYYTPYFDVRSTKIARGQWETDKLNLFYHEAGLNWTVGPLTINPALISEVNLNDSSASIASNESRVYSAETTTYNLNFYANF
jgi:hypothetical protein